MEGRNPEDHFLGWFRRPPVPLDAGVRFQLFSGALYWICTLAQWFILHSGRSSRLPRGCSRKPAAVRGSHKPADVHSPLKPAAARGEVYAAAHSEVYATARGEVSLMSATICGHRKPVGSLTSTHWVYWSSMRGCHGFLFPFLQYLFFLCPLFDSALLCPLLDSALSCPLLFSALQCPLLQGHSLQCPLLQGQSLKSPHFQSAPKCPRFQSAPKCPLLQSAHQSLLLQSAIKRPLFLSNHQIPSRGRRFPISPKIFFLGGLHTRGPGSHSGHARDFGQGHYGSSVVASRIPWPAMALQAPCSAMAVQAPCSAMAAGVPRPTMVPRVSCSTLEASPVSLSYTGIQGDHPPSPVVLLRRGTRLPGGGGTVTERSCSTSTQTQRSLSPVLWSPAPVKYPIISSSASTKAHSSVSTFVRSRTYEVDFLSPYRSWRYLPVLFTFCVPPQSSESPGSPSFSASWKVCLVDVSPALPHSCKTRLSVNSLLHYSRRFPRTVNLTCSSSYLFIYWLFCAIKYFTYIHHLCPATSVTHTDIYTHINKYENPPQG